MLSGGIEMATASAWRAAAIEGNEAVAGLPRHLRQFIVDQRYERYTPVDHAVWRYIMRQNVDFLRHHAHGAYLDGLKRTGISLEAIPRIGEMNEILGRIGWGAVTVDGFIPPAAFMEFQAHRVLVIAADMRQIDHISYTPAPDIVHEAAGHAPIIADPLYAEYLRRFGEVGAKAMSSKKDYELYEAIRHLSILKEAPGTDSTEIARAEREVEERQRNLGEPSEMARLSRLHWWTVEFGLIGDLARPKIYGAGLLSSIGESANAMTDRVAKLPYSIAAADVAFDITTQQPHLFVTPDFDHLLEVLEEFAATMAFRTGGMAGLAKAVESGSTATVELSSGIHISGTLASVIEDGGEPAYLRMSGPAALAAGCRQLEGHGRATHGDGFGTPVGRLAGSERPLEACDDGELRRLGIVPRERTRLAFVSGVTVDGTVDSLTRRDGKLLLISFSDCTVRRGSDVLFEPAWGRYDMAVGASVASVFSGAADKDAFEHVAPVPAERTIRVEPDETTQARGRLYDRIRRVREGNAPAGELGGVWRELESDFPDDWLAGVEIVELLAADSEDPGLEAAVRAGLEARVARHPEIAKLVADGLRLVGRPTG